MNSTSWTKGSLLERLAVKRLTGAGDTQSKVFDVFGELQQVRKILILHSDRVGGLFLGAPVYKAVRQKYESSSISLFSDQRMAGVARYIPFVDEVIAGDLRQPTWRNAFSGTIDRLRREQFDLALCLGTDCSFRLAQVCGASGARLRVGFKRDDNAVQPFNIELVRTSSDTYEVDQYVGLLRLLGIPGGDEVRWTISEEKAQQVRDRYLDGEFAGRQVVAVDLGKGERHGLSSRQMEDVVGRVIERGGRAVIFFSLAEKKQVNYLERAYGNRILAFDQQDLAGVAALLEGCRALISCNTDLLHLAISLHIPAVGIIDDNPRRWISTRNPLVKVVATRDMRALRIAEVVEALEAALNEESA
jgi:ADP-heptose:LPS heptosyltransferase